MRKEKRQGMLPFMVELGNREEVTGRVGLTLVVEATRALGLDDLVSQALKVAKRRRGSPEYAKIEALPSRVTKLFFRGDSADYYLPLLKYLVKEQIVFAISADMSRQLRKCCERIAETDWLEIQKREREVVHVAEVAFVTDGRPKSSEPLRYVAIRFTPIQRELFAEQDRGLKYVAVVTNRPKPAEPGEPRERNEMSAADLVRRHREKAGTIEHVHRSMKDELGAGILPCQKFGANAAWFRINVLTYNVLTFLKRNALPDRYRDARPKRLRFEVFTMPGRLTFHQRQTSVNVSCDAQQVEELVDARGRLLHFHSALRHEE